MGLQRLEDALAYLNYHQPTELTLPKHQTVNTAFQTLMREVWDAIPDGPGKTTAIRAIGRARMECNSAIANEGE
jgi:hypothetical protein